MTAGVKSSLSILPDSTRGVLSAVGRSINFSQPGANSRQVQQSVSDRQQSEWGFGHDKDGGFVGGG